MTRLIMIGLGAVVVAGCGVTPAATETPAAIDEPVETPLQRAERECWYYEDGYLEDVLINTFELVMASGESRSEAVESGAHGCLQRDDFIVDCFGCIAAVVDLVYGPAEEQ